MENILKNLVQFFSILWNGTLLAVLATGIICASFVPQVKAACTQGPDGMVTCTGNEANGIASGIDFTSPPATTLYIYTDPITPSSGPGVIFSNSIASSVNIISGVENNPVIITTLGNNAPGIKALSEGSPTGYHWQSALGLYVPNGPGGGGGPVSIESHGAITTSGSYSHGIVAQNRVGTYDPLSTATLSFFSTNALDISLVSVAGNASNIGTEVAGDNGGSFTLNNNGDVSFVRGTLGNDLQPGQSIVTRLNYRVQITHNPLFFPGGNSSQFSDGSVSVRVINENGSIVVRPLEIYFDEFGMSSDPAGPRELWPNLQGYADRLLAEQGFGGAGENIVVTNNGHVTTTGYNSHGIYAETTGGTGSTGSEGGLIDGPAGVGGSGSGGGGIIVTANGEITTFGNESAGVAAISRGGNGGTGGDGGWGGWRWGGNGGTGGDGGAVYVYGSGEIVTGALLPGQSDTDLGNYSSGIIALSEGGNGGNGGEGHHSMPGGNGGWGGRGGTVVVDGNWNITTRGIWAHGIWAKSVGGNAGSGGSAGWMGIGGGGSGGQATDGGSVMVTSGGAITTWGSDSYGIFAQSVGGFGGSGGDGGYIFYSNNGDGNSAGSGGGVTVTNEAQGSITTHGDQAHGIYAQSIGGGGGAGIGGGAIVSVGGTGGAGGHGGAVTIANNGSIRTYGDNARGIFAESIGGGGGSGGGSGGIVSIGGDGSSAGNGGTITITNTGTIETGAFEPGTSEPGPMEPGAIIEGVSSAIHAQSIGGGGGSGAGSGGVVSLGGNGLSAGNGGAVSVTNSGTLITWADFSRGILAQSIGGGGGDGAGSGGVVSLGGEATSADTNGDSIADTFGGGNGGIVTIVNGNSITTHGDYSDGIYVQSIGGGGGSGAGSGALAFSIGGSGSGGGSGSTVTITNNGSIRTEGYRSRGIFAQSIGGGGGDGAGSGGILSFGGSGSSTGDGGNVTVTNTGTIETGTFEPGTSDPGVIEPGTMIEGISSAIHAQSIGGGGGSGAGSGGLLFSVGGDASSAGNGGAVSVTNSGTLITWADFSRGILAQSIGGGGGDGADSGGLIGMGGSTGEDTDGNGAADVGGGNGGIVTIVNSTSITTHGDYSDGIYVQSIGGGGGSGGSSGGFEAIGGIGSRGGSGSTVTITNNGSIRTEGYRSRGIFAESIGGGGGDGGGAGGVFSIGGSGSSTDDSGDVTVTNRGIIETMEGSASAIHAQSIGGGGGSGGSARTFSFGANIGISEGVGGSGGGGGNGGTLTITNENSIITHKENSHGIFAQSIGGGGGDGGESVSFSLVAGVIPDVPVSINSNVTVGGSGSGGGRGGTVQINNNGNISTADFRSYGIFAQSIGGGGGDGGSSSSVSLSINCNVEANQVIGGNGGGGGNGGFVGVGTTDVAATGVIETQGDHSVGILAQSVGGGGGAGGDATMVSVDLSVPTGAGDLVPASSFSLTKVLGGNGGVAGNGVNVLVNSANTISTGGSFAYGILAQSVGGGGGAGGDARTYSFSFSANPTDYIPYIDMINFSSTSILGGDGAGGGTGGDVTVTSNGTISTEGASAYGILAQSVGGGGGASGSAFTFEFSTTDIIPVPDLPINPTSMESILEGGHGGTGNGGGVTVTSGGTITTQGALAHGILAQSVGGGGGVIGAVNQLGVINTNFDDSTQGILEHSGTTGASFLGSLGGGGSGGAVTVTQTGSITTLGQASHGILAQSAGGSSGGPVNVTTSGNIIAQGLDSTGILAQSAGGWQNNNISITVNSGTVQGGSGDGTGVSFLDGANNVLVNRGIITTLNNITGTGVRGAGGSETINNYGIISGVVDLGGGNNTFNNNAGATFNTGATINLGAGRTLTNAGRLSPGGAQTFLTSVLTGNYVQNGTGVLDIEIGGEGTHDKLMINGGSVTLDGALSVMKQPGLYRDGAVYDIVETTGGINGSFSQLLLPEARPLLRFVVIQQPNMVEVEVDAPRFTTIATNPVALAVTDYLDRIAPTATGDLLNVLGEFQSLSASQFDSAISSLSPGSYDNFTKTSYIGSWQHTGSLQRRMSNIRSYNPTGQGGASKPLLLAFAGSDAALDRFLTAGQLSQAQTKNGLWLNGYQQWGDQRGVSGFTGFDYSLHGGALGFDHTFSNNLLAGVSIGHSRTSVNLHDHWGGGFIKNMTGSLYGSYFSKNVYIEGSLSYGKNRYDNHRYLTIGSIQRRANSAHAGDTFSAYLGGGYHFNVNEWAVGPFGSLKYVYLNEEGFTETGAESLNLKVNRRKTDSLVSELGIRAARAFKTSSGSLIPELSGALNYDFDIDDRVITASFSGSPGAEFSMGGQKVEKYGATVGIGLTFIHNSGVSTSLKYSGEFREKYQSHGIMGQLRIRF